MSGPLRAQAPSATELGTGVTVVLAHRGFWGPALGVARRAGSQGRFALSAAGGDYDRALGLRLEATAQFLLRPTERRAPGLYGGLGLAFLGAEGAPGAGYLLALVGVEAAPGARAGWYTEVGLGDGVRVALGWRFRRFPAWW
jgi:hypothetical protein